MGQRIFRIERATGIDRIALWILPKKRCVRYFAKKLIREFGLAHPGSLAFSLPGERKLYAIWNTRGDVVDHDEPNMPALPF